MPGRGGKVCACAEAVVPAERVVRSRRQPRHRGRRCWSRCPWRFPSPSAVMAFAPMGPEASFFAVLDQHRASLLAALRRGGGEPAGGGTPQASR